MTDDNIETVDLKRLPRAIAVTFEEGGEWQDFPLPRQRGPRVHSIKFDDGNIWDAVNGWRRNPRGGA